MRNSAVVNIALLGTVQLFKATLFSDPAIGTKNNYMVRTIKKVCYTELACSLNAKGVTLTCMGCHDHGSMSSSKETRRPKEAGEDEFPCCCIKAAEDIVKDKYPLLRIHCSCDGLDMSETCRPTR